MTMHNSIPQFGRPAHRRVLAEIALDGINGGIFYVLRSREVWLASAEVHNIYSLLAQLVGFATTAMVAEGSIRLIRSVSLNSAGAAATGVMLVSLSLIFWCSLTLPLVPAFLVIFVRPSLGPGLQSIRQALRPRALAGSSDKNIARQAS